MRLYPFYENTSTYAWKKNISVCKDYLWGKDKQTKKKKVEDIKRNLTKEATWVMTRHINFISKCKLRL